MSYDFIEDAADILEKDNRPYIIIQGNAANNGTGVVRMYNVSDKGGGESNKLMMIEALREFADDLEAEMD